MSKHKRGRKELPRRYRFSPKKPINAVAASVLPKHKYRRCPTGNVSVAAVNRMMALAERMPNTLRELALLKEFARRRRPLIRANRRRRVRLTHQSSDASSNRGRETLMWKSGILSHLNSMNGWRHKRGG
jgi:hypothetical protein